MASYHDSDNARMVLKALCELEPAALAQFVGAIVNVDDEAPQRVCFRRCGGMLCKLDPVALLPHAGAMEDMRGTPTSGCAFLCFFFVVLVAVAVTLIRTSIRNAT